jgi:hypothetical protein
VVGAEAKEVDLDPVKPAALVVLHFRVVRVVALVVQIQMVQPMRVVLVDHRQVQVVGVVLLEQQLPEQEMEQPDLAVKVAAAEAVHLEPDKMAEPAEQAGRPAEVVAEVELPAVQLAVRAVLAALVWFVSTLGRVIKCLIDTQLLKTV